MNARENATQYLMPDFITRHENFVHGILVWRNNDKQLIAENDGQEIAEKQKHMQTKINKILLIHPGFCYVILRNL